MKLRNMPSTIVYMFHITCKHLLFMLGVDNQTYNIIDNHIQTFIDQNHIISVREIHPFFMAIRVKHSTATIHLHGHPNKTFQHPIKLKTSCKIECCVETYNSKDIEHHQNLHHHAETIKILIHLSKLYLTMEKLIQKTHRIYKCCCTTNTAFS